MAKTETDRIADRLRTQYGGMLKLVDVQTEIGLQKSAAIKWVNGLRYVNVNGRKKYLVSDIAEKINNSIHTQ